ncbi:hypothetical protein [Thermomonas carbonis]|uniref:LA2681-like HEPN domain-containing protein n=1 Tax=Thermomonas carbonis TaxID=1463158 RepID=A0A7G9SNL7_9GAMM|nr:hypothetical protein [Thermomonas carbonis]QNN69369.1 hypothetical protein H9L16_11885 [Thermomonas carbonis]QNN69442.1 hypothetical protein H9L16_12255 [Thermomonas carbonis]
MSKVWIPTSKQHELLFAELGRCVYVFQGIEARLKMMLPHLIPPGKDASLAGEDPSNWRLYLDSKNTLGPLIQKLKEHVDSSHPELLDRDWTQIVKYRNEVMHHYVEQPFSRLDTESKFYEALNFLRHRRETAVPLLLILQDICIGLIDRLESDGAHTESIKLQWRAPNNSFKPRPLRGSA